MSAGHLGNPRGTGGGWGAEERFCRVHVFRRQGCIWPMCCGDLEEGDPCQGCPVRARGTVPAECHPPYHRLDCTGECQEPPL